MIKHEFFPLLFFFLARVFAGPLPTASPVILTARNVGPWNPFPRTEPNEISPLVPPIILHEHTNHPDHESLLQFGRQILQQTREIFLASIILLIFLVVLILICLTN